MPRTSRRLSSIDQLPDSARCALNAAIAKGNSSVDALHLLVRQHGGDEISRSAVGRYKKREEKAARIGAPSAGTVLRDFLALEPVEQDRFRSSLRALAGEAK